MGRLASYRAFVAGLSSCVQRGRVVRDTVHRLPVVVGLWDRPQPVVGEQAGHWRCDRRPAARVEIRADVVALALELDHAEVGFEAVLAPCGRRLAHAFARRVGVHVDGIRDGLGAESTAWRAECGDGVEQPVAWDSGAR